VTEPRWSLPSGPLHRPKPASMRCSRAEDRQKLEKWSGYSRQSLGPRAPEQFSCPGCDAEVFEVAVFIPSV
jgi:hypothetical protein